MKISKNGNKKRSSSSSPSVNKKKKRMRKRSPSTSSTSSSNSTTSYSSDGTVSSGSVSPSSSGSSTIGSSSNERSRSSKKDRDKVMKKNIEKEEESTDVPIHLMDKAKTMAPMTKEQWEKQQSVVKRVYDENTGRHRLIKGDGEVVEEIVSKERHKNINKTATKGDGDYFQRNLSSGNCK